MAEQNKEVLFESWGYKYIEHDSKKSLIFTTAWKKRYFIVQRVDHLSKIIYYDKKPKSGKEKPKGSFDLFPEYNVQKHYSYKQKPFVCELTGQDERFIVGFDDEKLFHLMSFFVQTQTQLREQYEGECFVVRPDNSEAHRKIGARGNMCLLHISQWGVILSLQLCKCILGLWPLKALKWYESSGRQQFGFEAGRKSPMGGGIYVFNTRPEQDNAIYDRLDSYVMEAAGFKQMDCVVERPGCKQLIQSVQSSNETLDNISMTSQLLNLQYLVTVHSDARFTATLKRISRDIYDHLSQHLGTTSSTRPGAISSSSSDLLGNGNSTFGRSVSSSTGQQPFSPIDNTIHNREGQTVPVRPRPVNRTDPALGIVSKNRPYENEVIAREAITARKIKQEKLTSSYLSMNSKTSHENLSIISPTDSSVMDSSWSRQTSTVSPPVIDNHGHPPHSFYSLQRPVTSPKDIPGRPNYPSLQQQSRQSKEKMSYLLAQRISDPRLSDPMHYNEPNGNHLEFMSQQHDSYSPVTSDVLMEKSNMRIGNEYTESDIDNMPQLNLARSRLKSRSLEDFTPYERMSQEEVDLFNHYQNEGFRMSDEVSPNLLNVEKVPQARSPGFYSYASPQKLLQLSSTSPQSASAEGYNYVQDNGMLTGQSTNSGQTQHNPKVYTDSTSKDRNLKPSVVYRKPALKGNSLRKSRSIPNLVSTTDSNKEGTGYKPEVPKRFVDFVKAEDSSHKTDQLAFANNMFKDEVVPKVNSKAGVKPDVRPKPSLMLSMFKRQQSGDSTSSGTSGIRSMSESPVSPISTGKSPGPGVKGITFTPKSKSFKKVLPPETSDSALTGNGNFKMQMYPDAKQDTGRVLRRKSSESKMEGRRLPSLPPGALLDELKDNFLVENGAKYEKVKETLC